VTNRIHHRPLRLPSLALVSGGILFASSPAAANGRFPAANQIVFSPSDPDLIVLRASYGVMPSHDNGATWQFLCEEAFGVGFTAVTDPPIALTNHSLLAGTSQGLNVSPDVGCNWSCVPSVAGQTVVDLAVRPDSPSRAVALTGTFVVQPDSGQELESSQVLETNDDGASWTTLGAPIDPQVVVTTVDVTTTDPNRLYVSGTRGYGSQRTASLFVSTDAGSTWTERPVPAAQYDPTMEDSIFIGGIDPTNADRLYLRSSALTTGGKSRLTVVTLAADGTPSFSTAHVFDGGAQLSGDITGEMLGFALSPDGSKIYIGSQEDGLWVAQASDLSFTKNSSIDVQCLATRGTELWACSDAVSGFVAGVSTDDGKTFTPKLPLVGALSGPIACSAKASAFACGEDANASQCGPFLQTFCAQDGCETMTTDSSTGDASLAADASKEHGPSDAGTSSESSSSCDLAMAGRGGAAGLGAGFALIGLALHRRRRR
jgi:photosystem II stability/assembly factor-like uncharacterized protein